MPDLEPEQWLEPWEAVPGERRAAFEAELASELGPGHPLYGRPATALGRRTDCDDVLFRVEAPDEFVVVHLTYASRPEEPPWPVSEPFGTLRAFVDGCMVPDHQELSQAGARDDRGHS